MTAEQVQQFGADFDDVFFIFGLAILLIELLKGIVSKTFRKREFLDMVASISTQIPSLLVEVFILSLAYAGYVLLSETWVTWPLPINVWTASLAVLACDFVYYWEHRISHELRVFWTQHAVHHSSRHMNATVAIRFGPLEGVVSVIFHLPLILIGFSPALVFFGILAVLAYQTWIHTELIGKLGILDGLLNTPANHRVHHGCDDKYLDKNYGGILIIWDRIFRTYQSEEERPRYGLKRDFHSVNPFKVWVSELPQFFRDLKHARTSHERWMTIFGRPGWAPNESKNQSMAKHDGGTKNP